MPIVSSTHTVGHAQRDGRRYVREVHTDQAGSQHHAEYLAANKTDYAAVMAARAAKIDAVIVETEQKQAERSAAEAKIAVALDVAVTAGTLTREEIEKAGYVLPTEKAGR